MTICTQIGYRLHDWHNGFSGLAEKVVQRNFEGDNSQDRDGEEEKEEDLTDGEFVTF